MTTFSNAWLTEQDYRTRIKAIPWEGYQRASLLSQEDLSLLQRVSSNQRSKQEAVWAAETETYASLYVRLLAKLGRNDPLQAVLVSIADMITDHEERIQLFLSPPPSDGTPQSPYPALLKHLESADDFVRVKAAAITSTFVAADSDPPEDIVHGLVKKISELVRSQNADDQEIGVQCSEQALRKPSVRLAAWNAEAIEATEEADGQVDGAKTEEGKGPISGLVKILRAGKQTPQMQYQLGFCFWLLTFEPAIANGLQKHFGPLPLLIELARRAVKEKVTRVVVATFRNLLTKASDVNVGPMLASGTLLPLVQNLATRKWSDDELKDDIDWLKETLEEAKKKMTTWDQYTSELESGQLRWSPPHTSDQFWRENVTKLNDKDYAQLKVLINLLSESEDATVLAVAASDLSNYIKHYELGKKTADRLGAKPKVMKLMSHPNADVQYRALMSVQQLISQPWAT